MRLSNGKCGRIAIVTLWKSWENSSTFSTTYGKTTFISERGKTGKKIAAFLQTLNHEKNTDRCGQWPHGRKSSHCRV